MLSIIIPYRNEDMLPFTIQRIKETCDVKHEIIVVNDGGKTYALPDDVIQLAHAEPVGNCFSRHVGIKAAVYEHCLVLDAHMNFWPDDWATRITEYLTVNPNHIICAKCAQLRPNEMDMEQISGYYWGAHLSFKDIDSVPRRRVLPCKWNRSHEFGTIGCVLGGAYGFRRDWYLNNLGGPWQYLRGWGSSEPVLSLINYMQGGESVLMDIEIGHMFRTGQYNLVPYRTFVSNIIFNMVWLAEVAVDDKDDLNEMIEHLQLKPRSNHDDAVALQTLDRSGYEEYRETLRDTALRSWADYKNEWMNPEKEY